MLRKLKYDNHGFTLVEIIVVVLIISITAGMIIPTFMGYFDSDVTDQDIEDAKELLRASQLTFYDMYAADEHSPEYTCVISGDPKLPNYELTGANLKKHDCDLHLNTAITDKIYKISEVDLSNKINKKGALFFIAMGKSDVYLDPMSEYYDPEKAYKVYLVIYKPTKNSKVFFVTYDEKVYYKTPVVKQVDFHFNGEDRKVDYMMCDNEPVVIQYYALKCGWDNNKRMDQMWGDIPR